MGLTSGGSHQRGLSLEGESQFLSELEVLGAGAVDDELPVAFLTGDGAGGVVGNLQDRAGGVQVVGQEETAAIGGEVDAGDPAFEIEGGSSLEHSGNDARQVVLRGGRERMLEGGEGFA